MTDYVSWIWHTPATPFTIELAVPTETSYRRLLATTERRLVGRRPMFTAKGLGGRVRLGRFQLADSAPDLFRGPEVIAVGNFDSGRETRIEGSMTFSPIVVWRYRLAVLILMIGLVAALTTGQLAIAGMCTAMLAGWIPFVGHLLQHAGRGAEHLERSIVSALASDHSATETNFDTPGSAIVTP